MNLALYVIARILGCRIVGHSWYYWATADESGTKFTGHRVCLIAACQRHEIRRDDEWEYPE